MPKRKLPTTSFSKSTVEKTKATMSPPLHRQLEADNLPLPRIFINYRRQDSGDAAAYLRAVLSRRFGAAKIFRDLNSIPLGADFSDVIRSTIASAVVCICLIGKNWLRGKSSIGKPRIFDSQDYVRIEIESALRLGIPVVPVLIDGATMPSKKDLPASIAKLATLNAVELSWFDGVSKIGNAIYKIEKTLAQQKKAAKSRAKEIDLKLDKGTAQKLRPEQGRSVILTAMEFSLNRQGSKITLDDKDFYRTLDKYSGKDLKKYGAFMFDDMIYIVDCIGVKRRNSQKRYLARTYPLRSIAELPVQLGLNRPVICSFNVYEDWFDENRSASGIIDFDKPAGAFQGATVGIITGWDEERIKLLTPWATWGNNGVANLTMEAAVHHLQPISYLRSVEAVEMPKPFNEKYLSGITANAKK
jgi:hypothetical protein